VLPTKLAAKGLVASRTLGPPRPTERTSRFCEALAPPQRRPGYYAMMDIDDYLVDSFPSKVTS